MDNLAIAHPLPSTWKTRQTVGHGLPKGKEYPTLKEILRRDRHGEKKKVMTFFFWGGGGGEDESDRCKSSHWNHVVDVVGMDVEWILVFLTLNDLNDVFNVPEALRFINLGQFLA